MSILLAQCALHAYLPNEEMMPSAKLNKDCNLLVWDKYGLK